MSQQRGLRPLDPIFDPGKRLGSINVGNTPGDGSSPCDGPRFDWGNDVIDSVRISIPWLVDGTFDYIELGVVMATTQDILEFNVLVNGATVDTGTTAGDVVELFTVDVPVVLNDYVQIEIIDVGGGTAQEVSFALRCSASPTPPVPLLEIIGSVQDSTQLNGASDIVIESDVGYVPCRSDGTGRFTTVDVSDPTGPTIISSFVHANLQSANRVVKSGNNCFVSCELTSRMTVVGVANPASMSHVGSINHADLDGAQGIVKVGNYVFVCAYNVGLVSINVTTPATPTHADTLTLVGAFGIAVNGAGTVAFVTSFDSHSITAVDISDPNDLQVLDTLTETPELSLAGGIIFNSDICYVGTIDSSSYLTTVDVSNPSGMGLLGYEQDGDLGNAYDLHKFGDFILFPQEGASDFAAVYVADPGSPVVVALLSNAEVLTSATGIDMVGNVAFVACRTDDCVTAIEVTVP